MQIDQQLFALIKSWGIRPQFVGIVVSIARHWKTPERWETNLRSIYKYSPEWFFSSKSGEQQRHRSPVQPTAAIRKT